MTFPQPKFAKGQKVWFSSTAVERKRHPCPDCLGSGKWSATSPAGTGYTFPCPRCQVHYVSNNALCLDYSEHEPTAELRTIGSIRINTEDKNPVTYMCHETGVGSGSVYAECELFETENAALEDAKLKAGERNAKTKWVTKQYDESLRYCDYQMDNAQMRAGRDTRIAAQVRVETLFEELRGCETMDEVRAILESDKEETE